MKKYRQRTLIAKAIPLRIVISGPVMMVFHAIVFVFVLAMLITQ